LHFPETTDRLKNRAMAVMWIYSRAVDPIERLRQCTEIDWDAGNAGKNWEKHQGSDGECEQPFFNQPLIAMPDHEHSDEEDRILVLGKTDSGRKLSLRSEWRASFEMTRPSSRHGRNPRIRVGLV
jgi:uncharacterized DUF497 family protein